MESKSVYFDVGGFDEAVRVFHDWAFFKGVIDVGAKYSGVDHVLTEWIDHTGERISPPNSRRAEGIDYFVARYRGRIARSIESELARVRLGRWLHDNTPKRVATVAKLTIAKLQEMFQDWRNC